MTRLLSGAMVVALAAGLAGGTAPSCRSMGGVAMSDEERTRRESEKAQRGVTKLPAAQSKRLRRQVRNLRNQQADG